MEWIGFAVDASNVRCNQRKMSNYSVMPYRLLSYVKAHLLRISLFVLFLVFVWPDRYASHYPYISHDEIYDSLVKKTTANVSKATAGKLDCEYSEIIAENRFMYREPYISQLFDGSDIRIGGEYMPTTCAPLFSTALIVVYRNRADQLQAFLTYIHNFLRKQQIHYRIFIVEQYDQKPFNRAMLFNIGSLYAARYGFPCMILHDVDLMPLRLGNLYACTPCPRHMCAGLDKFRFNLLYQGLFGGAVSVETSTFQFVNGMSNMVSATRALFVHLHLLNAAERGYWRNCVVIERSISGCGNNQRLCWSCWSLDIGSGWPLDND